MIEIKIPLKKFSEINGNESCKGQTIICDTSYSEGVLDYYDIFGICREKDGREITTTHQANVVLKLNDENELMEAIKKYKPTDLWL